MNKMRLCYILAGACLSAANVFGGHVSASLEAGRISWSERVWGSAVGSRSGRYYGPRLQYDSDKGSLPPIDFKLLQGQFGGLNRTEAQVALIHPVSSFLSTLTDAAYFRYRHDQAGRANGWGAGGGFESRITLFESSISMVAGMRAKLWALSSNSSAGSGTPISWEWDAKAHWDLPPVIVDDPHALFIAAGYRNRTMRGSSFNERLSFPYLELGFTHRF